MMGKFMNGFPAVITQKNALGAKLGLTLKRRLKMEELTHAHRKILRFLKKGQYTVEELAELTFFSQQTIRGRMAEMKRLGYAIEAIKSDGDNKRYYIPAKPLEKQTSAIQHTGSAHYRIALLSDTHLGAETEDLDSLHKFYQIAKEKGVREFYHSGDMCVLPNTLILTREGFKEISKINIGDEVLTHKNRWKKVINLYKREIKEEIIEIHDDASDYPTLSLTKNHPVWTSDCIFRYIANRNVYFKEAGKLTLNNTVIGLIETEQFKEKKQIQLRRQSIQDKINSSKPGIINIDDDFLTVIGLFLGDGSVNLNKKRGSVNFYFENRGKKIIAHKIIMRWCRKNKINLKSYRSDKNMVVFYFHYKPLAEFFNMFYDTKRNKIIPVEWLNIPLFQFKKIIYGLILSDGTYGHRIRINNTSIDLLKRIKTRLSLDRIFATLNISRKKKIGKIMSKYCNLRPYYELLLCNKSCKEIFDLFGETPSRNGSRRIRTSFFYTIQRIERIKKKNYKGDVYNLDVEEDNSYIANGIIVHNCDGTGVYPGQIAGLKVFTGMKQVEYAAANYPEVQGCKSMFITGNHDLKLMEREDIDIGPMIASRRSDMIYLGQYEANVYFEKASLRLIHPDGGMPYAMCFDDKTEILTENGWKLFKDINKKEKVATFNINSKKVEWQTPTDYIEQQYNGKMLSIWTRRLDLVITPNHRLLVKRSSNKNWKLIEAEKLEGEKMVTLTSGLSEDPTNYHETALPTNFDKINYKGIIYCVSVPNQTIFVRRNGKKVWTGNSYRLQKYVENIAGGTKPNIISMGHLHQSLYAEIRNIHCFLPGSFQRQNNFLRRKGVDPQISAWIIDFNLVNKNVDGVKITEVNNLKTEKIRFY